MAAPNPEKGARYLAQLGSALCAAAWPDVPEYARKVEKHAPERGCLALAARCEAQIASASHRPTSASSSATSSIHSLGDLVSKLQQAIGAETRHAGDVSVAAVCLAEIHWLRGEEDEALKALQQGNVSQTEDEHGGALGWEEVCRVKASFLRAAAFEARGAGDDARKQYLDTATRVPGARTAELRRWTERLLARACMFMWRRANSGSTTSLSDALRCFQAWSDFWQRASPSSQSNSSHLDIGRRDVWKAYYHLLSILLQQGLLVSPSQTPAANLLSVPHAELPDEQLASARLQQRRLMKTVETTYESLLLSETQFPKASQTNTEVEEWVERVIANWKVFCSSAWSDDELGNGGQVAVSRSVLDILYRASTKTFHSTAILRQLFTVHASLGDFDLAMHAFDSYAEIVSQGKTRAEKTGKHETGFDSDDTAICTATEAVKILCRYGSVQEAEKANAVVRTLGKWLGQRRPESSATVDTANGDSAPQSTESTLQAKTLTAAYRAMGTSKANWVNLTPDNDARERLRSDAIKYLQQAQAQDRRNIETSIVLATTLAESRNIEAATRIVRDAIAAGEAEDDEEDEGIVDYQQERSLMPLWHLLALCRTANDEYEQASKMCEAAFEQFGDSIVLFGECGIRTSIDSEKVPRSARGIVDQMDSTERQSVLQIKMTQVSLIELTEGPETAVKSSEELLALYTRLFGSPMRPKTPNKPPPTVVSTAPPRSRGTLRSIAGSIRSRSRSARRSAEKETYRPTTSIFEETNGTAVSGDGQTQPSGAPIAITVTNEDGVPSEKHHHHLPFKLRGHHHPSKSLRSSQSNERLNEKALPSTPEQAEPRYDEGRADDVRQSSPVQTAVAHSEALDHAGRPQQPLGRVPHNAASDAWPPPSGHRDQPLQQDVRLPVPHPSVSSGPQTHVTGLQERQHKISLLVEVWLFIAGLYLRADHFDDCTGAVDAAFRLVEQFEEEVAAEHSSARNFFEKRWGLGKSLDELWGDVWNARGVLATSLQAPFEALSHFENCLSYWPDHADGIIGLSNLLMDMYEEKLPVEEPEPSLLAHLSLSSTTASGSSLDATVPSAPLRASSNTLTPPPPPSAGASVNGDTNPFPQPSTSSSTSNPSPTHLTRLASRDRAYMLLSTLTKLGSGADNPEAWLALARNHELSGQKGRAKKALWWVLKLEESRGIRGWEVVRAW